MSEGFVKEVTVGIGQTEQHGEKWSKRYYEVVVNATSCENADAVKKLVKRTEDMVETFLMKVPKRLQDEDRQMAVRISGESLDKLPWTEYKRGSGMWIKNPVHFTTFSIPAEEGMNTLLELVKTLQRSPHHNKAGRKTVTIGGFNYAFSGKEKETNKLVDMFIAREPVEE